MKPKLPIHEKTKLYYVVFPPTVAGDTKHKSFCKLEKAIRLKNNTLALSHGVKHKTDLGFIQNMDHSWLKAFTLIINVK